MQKMATALILIILGLIVIAFPALGLVPIAVLSGFLVLMLGIGLILAGISEMGESMGMGLLVLILGIIALILGIGFIFSPSLFAWVVGFIVWIIGLFLIIAGIVGIISKSGGSRWTGVISLIIGIIYLVIGLALASYTWLLGYLIGLWLIIYGIMMLVSKD
jgi:membrane protein HdeD